MVTSVRGLVDLDSGLIDRRIFNDPEIYEMELQRVFARSWMFVGHESQIPNPGDFITGYIAEDPIILCRSSDTKIRAFLNMCMHRGNRVCRTDRGNASSFMCSYHGWTYANDGKLISVPYLKDAYYEDLETERLGLVEVALVESYKGLIFANCDPQAPALLDYLGDATWCLDRLAYLPKAQFLAGAQRWVMDSNWKLAADNFIGDAAHLNVTHRSAGMLGPPPVEGFQADFGNGHGAGIYRRGDPEVGSLHVKRAGFDWGPINGSIFPNMSFLPRTIRVWHPRGPGRTEVWAWCIAEKDAPEANRANRIGYIQTFGPSGTWEQDDMDNWNQVTNSGRGVLGRRHVSNLQMGRGREHFHEDIPGSVGHKVSETSQRGLYRRWEEMMLADSWADISVAPRTTDPEPL